MSSILNDVKKMLGIDPSHTEFDSDILIHINTTLSILHQLGIESSEPLEIIDTSTTWKELIGSNKNLNDVKTYIYLKVRLMFDPPINSAVTEVMNKQISELEWRLNIEVDPGGGTL